jgi:hypothetical protein
MAHEIEAANAIRTLVMAEFRTTLWQTDVHGIETPLILNEVEIEEIADSIKAWCRIAVKADHDMLLDAAAGEAITAYWAACSIVWVRGAIERGNAPAIGRYLREHSVDPSITSILASMLERPHYGWLLKYAGNDPLAFEQLTPPEIADFLDPEKGRPKMRFTRSKKGNPGRRDLDALADELRLRLFFARQKEPKLNPAAELVGKKMGMGRSTILRWLARLAKPKNR